MKGETFTKRKLYNLLHELETNSGEHITLYVKPASFPYYIDELSLAPKHDIYADEIKGAVNIKAVIQEIEKYNTGAAIFGQKNGNKYIVLPPFPITKDNI